MTHLVSLNPLRSAQIYIKGKKTIIIRGGPNLTFKRQNTNKKEKQTAKGILK
jgi:hypothetical protein